MLTAVEKLSQIENRSRGTLGTDLLIEPLVTVLKIELHRLTSTCTHFKTHDDQTRTASYRAGNASQTNDANNESLGSVTDKYCSQSVLDIDVQSGGSTKANYAIRL